MISAEEFLEGRHPAIPLEEDDGLDAEIVQDVVRRDASDYLDTPDDEIPRRCHDSGGRVIETPGRAGAERAHENGRHVNRTRTHTVPVSSKYTSGFGRRTSDESDAVYRSNRKMRGWGKGTSSRPRYGTNVPMKRVPDDPLDADACREAALTLLDASARSSGALIKRLVGKGYNPVVAKDVVERLIQVRLIDDEEYARSVVRSCAARMMGFHGVVMELRRKGVDERLAQRVASEARSEGVFEDAAWQLGQRVAAKTQGMDHAVRLRRFWGAGGRKGHDPEVLRRVGNECFHEDSED
jgi:regulatory protein